jgi:hypothetical protein
MDSLIWLKRENIKSNSRMVRRCSQRDLQFLSLRDKEENSFPRLRR